ncbi:YafY family protein [Cohnella sp. REN36]|uniref:helix-turn-helix transcriptional regulator n=1 Tax=Cohnella sp. REN36 TaxID=2887347 RepID=UPI001D15477D|nr:YafY family transcriptional regulator [Cohnella sp. REN36]
MKLERLLSITYALLNQEVVSAAELAEKYGVSPRTIYRDIEAIGAAGIPVVSYQGVKGGFGIMKEYKLDRSLLGSDDLGSLVTFLRSAATVFKDRRSEETLQRLCSVLPHGWQQRLSLDLGSWRMNNELLHILREAIASSSVVHFRYVNGNNEIKDRAVEPVHLQFKYYAWYLQGYCRARRDYRVFKLSRITDLSRTEETFVRRESPPVMNVGEGLRRKREMTGAVIRISAGAAADALDCFYAEERMFDETGTLRIRIVNPTEVEWLVSMVLSFGGDADVEEPAWLREEIRDKIEKLRKRFEKV